jgi:hypothetical protein
MRGPAILSFDEFRGPREGIPWGPTRQREKVERGAAKTPELLPSAMDGTPALLRKLGVVGSLEITPTPRELPLRTGRPGHSERPALREPLKGRSIGR